MAEAVQPTRSGAHHAVLAGFLGWTLDAFDFFIVVFLFDTLAHQFGVTKKEIVWTTTATLAMRPLGALLFGLLADRYGRRIPLMANVIYFSIIELLCGFSPNFTVFLILRALFGVGMGGEWARYGSSAGALARNPQRNLAERLFHRLFACGDCREISPARVGMAPHVLDRRSARPARAVHPYKSAGIRSVEATPRCEHSPSPAHRGKRVEAFRLSRRAHDLYDVPLPRNAGSLSGLLEGSAQDFCGDGRQYRDDLQRRSSRGRDHLWTPLASRGAAQGDDRSFGIVALVDPFLGVRQWARDDHRRFLPNAGGSSGGMGRYPRAPE